MLERGRDANRLGKRGVASDCLKLAYRLCRTALTALHDGVLWWTRKLVGFVRLVPFSNTLNMMVSSIPERQVSPKPSNAIFFPFEPCIPYAEMLATLYQLHIPVFFNRTISPQIHCVQGNTVPMPGLLTPKDVDITCACWIVSWAIASTSHVPIYTAVIKPCLRYVS